MEIGAVIALVAAGSAIALALCGADRGATVVGGLFSAPALGWPPGVQEDDDVAWSWADARRAAATASDPAGSAGGAVPPTQPQPRMSASRR